MREAVLLWGTQHAVELVTRIHIPTSAPAVMGKRGRQATPSPAREQENNEGRAGADSLAIGSDAGNGRAERSRSPVPLRRTWKWCWKVADGVWWWLWWREWFIDRFSELRELHVVVARVTTEWHHMRGCPSLLLFGVSRTANNLVSA